MLENISIEMAMLSVQNRQIVTETVQVVTGRSDRMILATTLVIDVSGSMAGSRIAATMKGMKKLFDMHEPKDRIAFKVFDDKVIDLVGLKKKSDINWRKVVNDTTAKADVGGRTALYDAIAKAIETTNYSHVEKVSGRSIPCQREIVVFTDGEDTASTEISLSQLKKIMNTMTPHDNIRRKKLNITLIGAGVQPSYTRVLQDLCRGKNCQYLPCSSAANAIKATFQQVQERIQLRITQKVQRVTEIELLPEEFNTLQLTGNLSQFVHSGNSARISATSGNPVSSIFQRTPITGTNSQESSIRGSRGRKVARVPANRGQSSRSRGARKSRISTRDNGGSGNERSCTNSKEPGTRSSRGRKVARARGADSRSRGGPQRSKHLENKE